MNHLQNVDLHDVADYLKNRNLVDDLHLPYYMRWLQRFLTGPGSDPQYNLEDAQRVFLEEMDRAGQFSPVPRTTNALPQ